MGSIRKKILDMKKLAHKGKFKDAKKILDQHIEDEHHIHSDLVHLQRAAEDFQKTLENLNDNWFTCTKDISKFDSYIDNLESELKRIKYIINKLVRLGKIKLKI